MNLSRHRRRRTGRHRRKGRRSLPRALVLAAILAIAYYQSRNPGESELVTDVLDGDSLVIHPDGERRELRLYAVDAPEKGQAYGREAKAFATKLVKGKPVTIRVRDEDQYGRLVGEVLLDDGRSLNQALVEAGMAWWYRHHAEGDRTLARLEREAREAGRGLWAKPDPEPPWDYRRRLRNGE